MKLVSLLPLKEIDFPNQKAFQSYNKKHKLRPSTKVNIAGKQTTAGQAAKVKGTSVFGGKKEKSITDIKPDAKVDVSNISKSLLPNLAVKDPNGVVDASAAELEKRLKGNDTGVYTRTSPHGGEIEFEDGVTFDVYRPYDAHKTKSTKIYASKKSNSNKIESIIKNIADLTDKNDHNGAVMALAKMTGDKTYIEQMQKIQRYHELKGHMPQSLIKYRTAIMNNLLTQAKNQFGDKVAKQLHNAF